MKTNWKNKLKAVLAETVIAENTEISLKTELTKADKTSLDLVSSVFVSGELTDIAEKQNFQIEDLTSCPVCTATANAEQSEALRVTFCPFGCPFLVCRFTENTEAVEKAVSVMCETMTDDELEAKSDAIGERTAVFMLENGWRADFNTKIEIREREAKRVELFLSDIDQNEKTLVFCASQPHAALIRDLINQLKTSRNPDYCARVTADDGNLGEQHLSDFQDNEKTIPTVLTTSQKLSTGVDARNVRNIVLMRPVNSMIEFKQIIGRGTRLFDGKEYFTIYDFVNAYHHFADPEWDGEPIAPEPKPERPERPEPLPQPSPPPKKKVKIKLADGKDREIGHSVSTSFWSADGQPITAEQFLQNLFGKLPEFFKSEEELRKIWSHPVTRKTFLENLSDAGFGRTELATMQKLIDAQKSDLFDVLEYVSFAVKPITRQERVEKAQTNIFALLDSKQKEFLEFVLSKYIETGVDELDQEKLPRLLELKYHSFSDAIETLGDAEKISNTFIEFQKHLYEQKAA